VEKKILIIGAGTDAQMLLSELRLRNLEDTVEVVTDSEAKERGITFSKVGFENTESGLITSKIPINEMFEIRQYDTENIKSGRENRRERRKKNRKK